MNFYTYLADAGSLEPPPLLPNFPMRYYDPVSRQYESIAPREFQVSDLGHLLRHPRWGLFSDPGTGKSLTMHAIMLYYIGHGERVLCLMPPVLIPQFTHALFDTFDGSKDYVTSVNLTLPPGKRDKLIAEWDADGGRWPNILMMSYQMFLKNKKLLKEKLYNVVICDEAQALRGSESGIHKAILKYTQSKEDTALVLSTGTPVHNTAVDAYAMTTLLRRSAYFNLDAFNRRHAIFDERWATLERKTNRGLQKIRKAVRVVIGYEDIEHINKVMYKRASRVTKDQVLDLARPTILRVPIELYGPHLRLYNKLLRERMIEIEEEGILLTAELEVQLRELLMSVVLAPEDFKPGVKNALMDAVQVQRDAIGTDKKVLMFANHNRAVEVIAETFSADRAEAAMVYGGSMSSTTKNAKNAAAFNEDPSIKVMPAHPRSGGVGLNLQHACHNVFVVEPFGVHGDFTQGLARVWRGGQKHPVTCWVFEVQGTAYPAMVDRMLNNNETAAIANGDKHFLKHYLTGGV